RLQASPRTPSRPTVIPAETGISDWAREKLAAEAAPHESGLPRSRRLAERALVFLQFRLERHVGRLARLGLDVLQVGVGDAARAAQRQQHDGARDGLAGAGDRD